MNHIIDSSQNVHLLKDGISTVIIGKPNVGKSSLLNALLDEDKAIVTDIAGTTRDIVEGTIRLDHIVLNMIDTAGTIVAGAQVLKEKGAKDVYIACTHGVLSGPAVDRLKDCVAKEVIITDTIAIPEEKRFDKLVQISVAELLAYTIESIENDLPVKTPTTIINLIKKLKDKNALDRVLFGTDAPLGCYGGNSKISPEDAYKITIENLKTSIRENFGSESDSIINKIFYENAHKLFFENSESIRKFSKCNKAIAIILSGIITLGAVFSANSFIKKQNNITSASQENVATTK